MNNLSSGIRNLFKDQPLLVPVILFFGIFFRIFHFLDNRSLFTDEVFLASSLIHMDFMQLLTSPLEYRQRAPLGFLLLAKIGVVLFNKKEMALRLFPLLSGIAAIFIFVPVARYFLTSKAAQITAICIAALAPPLIYHSVEAKQYGVEFFATVLSLYLYTKFDKSRSVPALILWGLSGAVILWFSFSALFVLGGMATGIALSALIKKEWKSFFFYIIPFSIWLVSILVLYVLVISKYPEEQWLVQYWRNREAFIPLPHTAFLQHLIWYLKHGYSMVRYPLGLVWYELNSKHSALLRIILNFPLLPVTLALIGFREMWLRQSRHLLILAVPVLLALLASAFEFYPLVERLTIFLAPVFIIIVSKGIDGLDRFNIPDRSRNWIAALVVLAPFLNSSSQVLDTDLFGDNKKSRQREAMEHIQSEYKAGDVVYVYWNNIPFYKFYAEVYGFKFKTIYGSDVREASNGFPQYFENLSGDFAKIKGNKRLWYVQTPVNIMKLGDIEHLPTWYYDRVDANQKMFNQVSTLGKLKEEYPKNAPALGVKVSLFDLSPSPQEVKN